MKKYFGLFGLVAILAACDSNRSSDDGNIITRQCGNYRVEMSVNPDDNTMHAVINGDALDLTLAVSASGARYVGILNDTDVTLWGKGDDWTLFLSDEDPIECTVK